MMEFWECLWIGPASAGVAGVWEQWFRDAGHQWYGVSSPQQGLIWCKNHGCANLSVILIDEHHCQLPHVISMLRSGLNLQNGHSIPVWVVTHGNIPGQQLFNQGADGIIPIQWHADLLAQRISAHWRQIQRLLSLQNGDYSDLERITSTPIPVGISSNEMHRTAATGTTSPITSEQSHALLRRLTPREKEVLRYLEQGATNQTIAQHLSISPTTVKNHLAQVFKKLKVKNRTQAVTLAHQLGMFETEKTISNSVVMPAAFTYSS